MTSLFRVRTALTGFSGGPGVSTMYFLDTGTAIPSVRAFWEALAGVLPNSITVQVSNVGDEIESTTGALVGSFQKTAVPPTLGTNTSAYPAPAGAVVSWRTNTVADRRRLRGRTFIVPMGGNAFEINGTLSAPVLTQIGNAAQALVFEQSLSMVVWHRPRAARPVDGSRPAVTARLGSHGLVTGSRVPDLAAVLRSRRD